MRMLALLSLIGLAGFFGYMASRTWEIPAAIVAVLLVLVYENTSSPEVAQCPDR